MGQPMKNVTTRTGDSPTKLYCGQKVMAFVKPFGWEQALYIRPVSVTHHQIFRINAISCDYVKIDEIKAVEWLDDEPLIGERH